MSQSPPMNAETVLQALAVLHGDFSENSQRQQANQYCEQVKAHPQACLQVSLQLLQLAPNSLPPQGLATARHFALHGLQHMIQTNWNKFSEDEKQYIKTQAIGMAENSTTISGGIGFLKQTIARILTDIALREWPQRWPTMMDQLFRVQQVSPDGAEQLSLIFRNLAEEMTSADPVLPDVRRKEVQASLMLCLDKIVPFLTNSIRECVKMLAQDRSKLAQAKAHIEACHALLEWLPAKHVFESGLLSDLCSALQHPDLFELVCEALSSIVQRKSTTIDNAYHPQILATFDAVLNWARNIMGTGAFDQQNAFLLRLVNILNNLVSKGHVQLLLPPAQPQSTFGQQQQPQQQDAYLPLRQKLLSTLGQLFAYSYQKISQGALEVWVDIFRHYKSLMNVPEKQGLCTELLKLSCFRLQKLSSEEEWEGEQDFESLEEYNLFFSNFRGGILHLLQLLIEIDSNLCFQVARMRYEQLLSLPPPKDHLNKDGWVSYKTSRFLELEAVGSLLECLFRSVKDTTFKQDPQLLQTTEGLLRFLLNWQTEDPLYQTRRAHALSMFAPMLSLASQGCFQATIEALMNGVSFKPQMYAQLSYNQFSEDLKACRRRSIVSLIQLARRQELVQGFFLPLFQTLVSSILNLLQQKLIAQVEMIALFEFLVLISQSLSIQEQSGFLKNVLQEPLNNWTTQQMNALLDYPGTPQPQLNGLPSFCQIIGFAPEDQQTLAVNPTSLPPSHRTPSREMRSQIRFTLHTFMAVFKPLFVAGGNTAGSSTTTGVTSPIAGQTGTKPLSEAAQHAASNLLPLILPNVIRLLGHIYAIRSPRMRSILPQNMYGLLSPTADQLLNPDASTMATVSVPPPTHFHLVWHVRRWMDRVLDSAMTILMLAAKSGQIYYESLAQPQTHSLYISCLYSNLEHMHLREIRTLIDKYLESVFNLCPPHLYLAVFIGQNEQGQPCNTLPTIFTMLLQRLQQGWARVQSAKQPGAVQNTPSDSLSNEIHDENELRELSRCISENISRTVELQYVKLHTQHQATVAADPPITGTGREVEKLREQRQQEVNLLLQAPFCQFLFTQQGVLSSLLTLEIFLLSCPDSASSVRAIRLLHRLLPVAIGSRVPLAVQLYAQVFQSGVELLSTGKQQLLDAVESELTAMLKDIYISLVLGSLSAAPRQVLLSLPNVDSNSVVSLESTLGTVCAEKKHRAAMRAFLDRTIKQPRLNAQKNVLNSAVGTQAAQHTNPLDLLQSSSHAHTSGRVGQIDNLGAPLVLPPRQSKQSAADVEIVNLFE